MRFSIAFPMLAATAVVHALPTARRHNKEAGDASSGNAGDAAGGTVNYAPSYRESDRYGHDDLLGNGLLKAFSGNGGDAGDASSGLSQAGNLFNSKKGGSGNSKYPLQAGDAKSGNGGSAPGGSVNNVPVQPSLIDLFNNNAGGGGNAVSGLASGGDLLKGAHRS